MGNDLFQIGSLTVHGYGFMIALGLLSGYLIADYRAQKQGLDTNQLLNIFIASMIGCVVGGKFLYCMVEFQTFLEYPAILFDFENGFVIYGGLMGGFAGAYIYCKKMMLPFLRYFEMFVPSLAFAQGIGRIGCFLAGCCYGKPTNAWYGIAFENSLLAPNHIKLIPTQLMMSGLDLLLAGILFYLAYKKVKEGALLSIYVTLYSFGRFFIEFLRDDPRGSFLFLSTSQFIAIFGFVFGIFMIRKYVIINK